ncbi:LysR substrate-binding domain-containing protein [Paraburkholderia tagetis]|uniref:LysR substrate-binding domain-containing protein n=1 Tax=Paraburkholderia tagetis TaxID=2913261 RepID=A0A9X1RSI5_9BURK|nr:LysR substrate-binding domain-containing protein [Paraburkholderia tagetis]MCG5075062.1 LysR substrate-binding domain-containing protein [Paraburkholderia tagetis]
MRLPPLTSLRAFEAAARFASFTLAAQELYVTTGAISRQVKLLEAHLGVQLFVRHHRKVALTAAGQRYVSAVSRIFAELSEAGEALGRETQQALVRLDCVPTLSMYWLTPRLAEYREQRPDIRIESTTSVGPVDVAVPFDLAIRRDPRHFAGLAATAFMTEWSMPLCSREFAHKHGLISQEQSPEGSPEKSPEKMLRGPTIHIRAREDLWPTWTRHFGLAATAPSKRMTLDHTFAALQAAEDGIGAVVMPLLFARKQLSSGRLFAPFPEMLAESGKYYVLTRADDETTSIKAVKAWLLEQGEQSKND